MIKTNILFEKNTLNKEAKEHLMLVELTGHKKTIINKSKKKLNLSLVIDISGSMSCSLDGNYNNFNFLNNNTFNEKKEIISKLDLVKKAAINAIYNLNEGDYVSVVAFDDQVEVVSDSVAISKNNIENIIFKIKQLQPRSWTNLHGGWLEGCTQVAKNHNDKYLNRVIVLTDGQINAGQKNKDVIVSDVLNVYNKKISTTCFGVGSDFNEELLNAMADSGGGNFYYIEKEEDISDMFVEEFDGISNVCAFNTKLQLSLKNEFEIIECFNNYSVDNDCFLLPNITKNKLSILFRIKSKNITKTKKVEIGEIKITFNDSEGKELAINESISANTKTEKQWNKEDNNKEVKIQEILLSVAKNKEKASVALSTGNITRAKELLNESQLYMDSHNISDQRLSTETNVLGATLNAADSKSTESLKKDLFYQSYKTRTNK
jgi:Ca-activated chloride channel family protein